MIQGYVLATPFPTVFQSVTIIPLTRSVYVTDADRTHVVVVYNQPMQGTNYSGVIISGHTIIGMVVNVNTITFELGEPIVYQEVLTYQVATPNDIASMEGEAPGTTTLPIHNQITPSNVVNGDNNVVNGDNNVIN